ncbi:hypothetical protein DL96DRAFT_1703429 [Flagelloscypha sp. PMI_526]|nr:hypothetical protein DL96DRAFT_1703429 [Flagelloscypha sp. PMI_526]
MSRRAPGGGLPSGPGRSRSHARGGYDDPPRQVRPQKSMQSVASRDQPRGRVQRQHAPSVSSSSSSNRTDDDSSLFSSTSSFMDRIRAGTGYSSSRTSIDDDRNDSPSSKRQSVHSGANAPDGHSIWNTVASAASSLTVNVSKAWATNVTVLAGEETPDGAESRLTRAMKAYHREKARTPADLPAFLFTEEERRVREPVREDRSRRNRYDEEEYDDAPRDYQPSRGLRDVYASASGSGSSSGASERRSAETSRRPFGDSNNNSTPSKAN